VLCVGKFCVGLGGVCAVCGKVCSVFRGVCARCLMESLVLVWGSEFLLCVGELLWVWGSEFLLCVGTFCVGLGGVCV